MELSWNTLLSSAITASINGVFMYLSVRFVSKAIDRIEGTKKKDDKNKPDTHL